MTDQLLCPQCGSQGINSKTTEYLECVYCKTQFPILFGSIPVLLKNPRQFLADSYILYSKHIESVNYKCQLLHKTNNSNFDKRIKALLMNNKIFSELVKEIETKIERKDIAMSSVGPNSALYLNDFRYLRRDWSGDEESEYEVNSIVERIRDAIDTNILRDDKSLFLGGATGRLTIDLLDFFDQAVVMDRSLSMAKMFYEISNGCIDFFDIRHKNSTSLENSLVFNSVNIKKIKPNFNKWDKLQYIVSDATQIPYEDRHFGSIFSIYFTDVLPITILIKQVIRLLKPGGIFVHFGPLEYHFKGIEYMLTAEEIREIFAGLGFKILVNDTTDFLPHLYSKGSLQKKSYKNWIFVCRKIEN